MTERSAGAITYTMKDNTILYLLIRDFHGNYGFAKGHLEENESDEEAALREIREECGICVCLDPSFKEEQHYIMPNGVVKTVVYYLGFYEKQTPVPQPEEVQQILLLPYEEAMQILTFDIMKESLQRAHHFLTEKGEHR